MVLYNVTRVVGICHEGYNWWNSGIQLVRTLSIEIALESREVWSISFVEKRAVEGKQLITHKDAEMILDSIVTGM